MLVLLQTITWLVCLSSLNIATFIHVAVLVKVPLSCLPLCPIKQVCCFSDLVPSPSHADSLWRRIMHWWNVGFHCVCIQWSLGSENCKFFHWCKLKGSWTGLGELFFFFSEEIFCYTLLWPDLQWTSQHHTEIRVVYIHVASLPCSFSFLLYLFFPLTLDFA